MATEETLGDTVQQEVEAQQPPTAPAAMATGNKKRPRLDLDATAGSGRDRKRGKSMFGLVLGTLNKAKIEDKERSASEAAKKRQLIEQRLQNKLKKETDSVRRAEEAKKDKMQANRKEEELQLKDSIYKYRRTRLTLLSNFLITSDIIPSDDSTPPPPSSNPLALPSRSHPPPLYYLPAILTPAQEVFLSRRKIEVSEAAVKEWQLFCQERETGISDINQLRQRVADEEARRRSEKLQELDEMETDTAPPSAIPQASEDASSVQAATATSAPHDTAMEIDKRVSTEEQKDSESDKKDEATAMQADDDDAVEY